MRKYISNFQDLKKEENKNLALLKEKKKLLTLRLIKNERYLQTEELRKNDELG